MLVAITRAEPGGAQVHVRDLLVGLAGSVDRALVCGDEGWLTEQARASGVPVYVVPELEREIDPARDLSATRALRRLVRQLQPDLVHTHSSKAGLLGRLAARLERRPAIHTAHSWAFSDGIAWRRKALAIPMEAAAARWTRRFIVVSEADREVGLRYKVARPRQVRVVHNGVVDVVQRASPGAEGVPVLLMVARFAAPKEPLLLLRALARLRRPWRLRLVGDGPDRPAVQAQVDALGLADRVELLGTRLDVPELLSQAQIGLLISRQEGFPLVVLEAMRAGLPVIASDVGGIREAVEPGRTGALVPRGDEAALAAAIDGLLADPALRVRQGAAGRAAFEARFTVQRMLEGTLAVYREVAAEAGFPSPGPLLPPPDRGSP